MLEMQIPAKENKVKNYRVSKFKDLDLYIQIQGEIVYGEALATPLCVESESKEEQENIGEEL